MKGFKRGEKGFTMVELLIVVAILGILAAVVIPNVVGLLGRGGRQAYETDANTVELGAAAFYSDVHSGWHSVGIADVPGSLVPDVAPAPASFMDNVWADTDAITDPATTIVPGHYFPTSIAKEANHYLTVGNATDPDDVNNKIIVSMWDPTTDAADAFDVAASAIWMGLLVQPQSTAYNYDNGTTERWLVSALPGEGELYLDEMPNSAMTGITYNGDPDLTSAKSGGYLWIVGKDGQVYGTYKKTCIPAGGSFPSAEYWFAGFSGSYP